VAILFADPEARLRSDKSPTYLDIAAALENRGPCFTFPSPMLLALEAALAEYDTPEKAQAVYDRYHDLGRFVRGRLSELGLRPLAVENPSPVITTFAPPEDASALSFVARCRRWGFAIGGESGYLAHRRYVQIATMGAVNRDMVAPLFEHLQIWLAKQTLALGR
jgi:aspartate aminotransferase-like enzyme